jgi:hypothetical protein
MEALYDGGIKYAIVTPDQIIVQSGDTIAGKAGLQYLASPHLNDQGAFVFYAKFADNSSAIVLAAPVPEPGYAAVLAGLFALAWWRGRRAKEKKTCP